LKIASTLSPKIGDSVAVNGVCLTIVETGNRWFVVELSDETLQRVAVENYRPGKRLHLEPALRFGEPIDGHLLQGHIDGIGVVERITPVKTGWELEIGVPSDLIPLLPPKGSVGVDGVSLTIAEVGKNSFKVAVIPHTFKETLIGEYTPGRRVNLETDLFVRYLDHLLATKYLSKSGEGVEPLQGRTGEKGRREEGKYTHSGNSTPSTPPLPGQKSPPFSTSSNPSTPDLNFYTSLLHWW
jgi:riboflavin synthase